jgi:hypothetical protein
MHDFLPAGIKRMGALPDSRLVEREIIGKRQFFTRGDNKKDKFIEVFMGVYEESELGTIVLLSGIEGSLIWAQLIQICLIRNEPMHP